MDKPTPSPFPAPEQHWAVFPQQVDGKAAWMVSDLAWADRGSDPDRGVWLDLRVAFDAVGDDGLPEGPAMDAMQPIEDALIEALQSGAAAVHVGSMASDGHRHLFFYGESEAAMDEAIDGALESLEGVDPGAAYDDDPEWEHYEELLFPQGWQMSFVRDSEIIQAINAQGDSGETPRTIEHFAYFPDEPSRDGFKAWLDENKYGVAELLMASEPESETGPYGVRFTHSGPATLEEMPDRTWTITQAAEDFGGDYDGWETPVVKQGAPSDPSASNN